jgi:hypothetical protein
MKVKDIEHSWDKKDFFFTPERKKERRIIIIRNNNKKRSKHNVSQTLFGGHKYHVCHLIRGEM